MFFFLPSCFTNWIWCGHLRLLKKIEQSIQMKEKNIIFLTYSALHFILANSIWIWNTIVSSCVYKHSFQAPLALGGQRRSFILLHLLWTLSRCVWKSLKSLFIERSGQIDGERMLKVLLEFGSHQSISHHIITHNRFFFRFLPFRFAQMTCKRCAKIHIFCNRCTRKSKDPCYGQGMNAT